MRWIVLLFVGLVLVPFALADSEIIIGGFGDEELLVNGAVLRGDLPSRSPEVVTPEVVCSHIGETGEQFGKYFGIIALVSVLGVCVTMLVVGWRGGEINPDMVWYLMILGVVFVSLSLAFVVLSAVPC